MTDKLLGSYQFEKNENFEEFLVANGVPIVQRKLMVSTSPNLVITKEGNFWTISFKVLLKTNTLRFEIGKKFTENNHVIGEENTVDILI